MIPYKKYALLALTFWTLGACLFAQDSTIHQFVFGDGVTVRGGAGYLAVRDEFISSEKYAGTIGLFAATWSRLHETYGYRLACQYLFTSNLKNNNVSADVTQFSMNLDFLYPIKVVSLLGKESYLFLGPSAELFVHFRRQNIAGSGESILNAYSVASLISARMRSEVFYPIYPDFQLNGSIQLSGLSLGGRLVDPRKSDDSMLKFLTPFSGLHANTEIGMSYHMTQGLIATVAYRLEITRISSWDYFITGGDFIIIGVSYNL